MDTAVTIEPITSGELSVQEIEQRLRRVTLTAARLQLFFSSALVWLIFIFGALTGDAFPLVPTLALVLWLVGTTLALSFMALRGDIDFLSGAAPGRIALASTSVTVLLATFLAADIQSDFYLVYFFPMVVASVYYGLRGGVAAALLGALSYGYLTVVLNGTPATQLFVSPLIERLLFLFALAGALGVSAEGQRSLIGELKHAYTYLRDTTRTLETTRSALARRVQEAESLALVAREFTSTFDTEQVLRIVLEQVQGNMQTEAATIMLLDTNKQELVFQIPIGSKRPELEGYRLPVGQGIAGLAAQTGKPVRADNTVADTRHFKNVDQQSGFATRSALAVPMKYQDRVIGVIEVLNKREGAFTADDEQLLDEFAQWAAIAIQNAHLYQELQASMKDLQTVHEQMVRTEPLRALGQMAGGVAHDFNNLLAIILAEAQVLRASPHDERDIVSFRRIEQAARDATEAVRRIRDYTKSRSATPRQVLPIDELVCEAVDITRPRWQQYGQVALQLQSPGDILASPVELREVLTNLIFNAVDARIPGRQCQIAISTRRVAKIWALIVVEDNGTGIPQDVQKRIFDPYFTTKADGTGLGLSMAQDIIAGHGGDIRVTSPLTVDNGVGSGARFGIRLPLVTEKPDEVTQSAPSHHPIRILLVDDDPNILQSTVKLLALDGYEVCPARTASEAEEQLTQDHYQLVLTDLSMPGLSGRQLAARSKQLYPQRPVVLVTAWGDDAAGDSQGLIDGILHKPFSSHELEQLLSKLKITS